MTEQQGQEGTQGLGTGAAGGSGNPPYADYLQKFQDPAARSIAEQVFKEWDGNTTKRFQELHSQNQQKYGWADPLLENYEADDIQAAVTIAEQLQADPQGFLARLQEAVGGDDQGLGDQEGFGLDDSGDSDDPYAERFSQLEQALATIAEQMVGQQQSAQQKAEDEELESTLTELKEQHGEYDEDWVLAKALKNGGDLEAAVKEYFKFEEQVRTKALRPSPRPLGQGGGLPSSDIDPTKLSDREAKDLVRKILDEANQQ
jgi:hypothetical protein